MGVLEGGVDGWLFFECQAAIDTQASQATMRLQTPPLLIISDHHPTPASWQALPAHHAIHDSALAMSHPVAAATARPISTTAVDHLRSGVGVGVGVGDLLVI